MTANCIAILLGVALKALPLATLLALVTLPPAYKAVWQALRFHSSVAELIPANAATVTIHLATGLLPCVGYVLSRILV